MAWSDDDDDLLSPEIRDLWRSQEDEQRRWDWEHFQETKMHANEGDVENQYQLGILYFKGKGTVSIGEKAVYWLTKAANQGHKEAKDYLKRITKKKINLDDGSFDVFLLDGEQQCYGKYYYKDGSVYEGDYKDSKPCGSGIKTYKDGRVYEGEFKDGKPNGYGKAVFTNKDIYEGRFVNGQRTGIGKMTYANGKIEDGIWENGKYMGKYIEIDDSW